MKKNKLHRVLAMLMCLALLLGTFPARALAEENTEATEAQAAEKEEFTIATGEDFRRFEENCRIDAWSSGRRVVLSVDLNLPGDFSGIATFAGTFCGNGHTISGLSLSSGNGATGLFRYLEPEGKIQDLIVDGTLYSDDGTDTLGGIVGVNFGTIENCSFTGSMRGSGICGGIAGLNGASGTISRCTSDGNVTSLHLVGGVAGRNYGVISDCVHSGYVNGDSSWVDEDNKDTSSGLLNQGKEMLFGGSDIGGIAGWSGDTIAGCVNTGVVGYQKAGSNVGGIAGRQSGSIIRCQNQGYVYGKQDVGGIVGQFEPSVTLEDTEELSTEVNRLHELIDTTVDDLQSLTGTMHKDMSDLQAHSETARQTTDEMLKEARSVADANRDTLNDLSSRVDYVKNHLPDVMDEMDEAMDAMDAVGDDMDAVRDDLDILGKMDDSEFDPTKNDRLVLTSGVGGTLRANNSNPEAGTSVTVTANALSGYALKSLRVSGSDVTAQADGGSYTFIMPEENVQVLASFRYIGQYLPESNPGGQAQAAQDGDTLKVRAVAQDGYTLESIRAGSTQAVLGEGEDDVYALPLPENPEERIYVTFRSYQGYEVLTPRTTGGRVQADSAKAEKGSTVTVTVTTDSGYRLNALRANGTDILANQSGEKSYTFQMPGEKVTVQAEFLYEGDADVACTSNSGGVLSARENPVSNEYLLTLTPDSGYVLPESGTVLTLQDAAGTVKELTKGDLEETLSSYTYTISMNNYTPPIQARAQFQKTKDALTVTTVSSAGGTVTADKTQVSPGDTVSFALTSGQHYGLTRVTVNGEDKTGDVSGGILRYTVPDNATGEITVVAQYQPVFLALESVDDPASGGTGEGGSGSYTVSGTQVEVTLQPNAGYSVQVVEASSGIVLEKPYADSNIYRFPAQDGTIRVTFCKETDKATIEDAADRIDRNLTVISDRTQDMQDTYDAIHDLTTDEFGNPRDLKDLSDDELDELRDLMKELGDEITDVTVAAGQISSDTATIVRLAAPYLEDAAENLQDDLEKLSDDLDTASEHLQNAQKEAEAIVDYLNSLDSVEFTGFSEKFSENADKVSAEMETISKILSRLNDNLSGNSNRVTADLRKINDQLNVVLNLLIDRMDDLEEISKGGDLIVDLSAEPQEDSEDALPASAVSGCENSGTVDGTSNVGGIAGTVGIDADTEEAKPGIGTKYMVRAILSQCKNSGFITVRSENGGGIAGSVEAGLVQGCVALGSVTTETGKYMGGVAGTSQGTIDGSYSLAELNGGSFVGGIAGAAKTVSGCYAMPVIHDTTGRVGAISGADTEGQEDDPTDAHLSLSQRVRNNFFVGDTLGGVDGVSYDGIAQPVSYDTLLSMEGIPAYFRHLTVTFVDGTGSIIYTQEVPYGESLDTLTYPTVTAETGSYSDWEGYRPGTMEGNLILRSAQVMTTRILSGSGVGGKSPVLAEGNFTASARLVVEQTELTPPAIKGNADFDMLHVQVENGDLEETSVSRIRLYQRGEGDATVYLYGEDGWTEIPSEKIGQYLQVTMTGSEASFCVATVTKSQSPVWMHAAGAGVVAVAALLGIILVRKGKKKK